MKQKNVYSYILISCVVCITIACSSPAVGKSAVPPSWQILPIPRYANYDSSKSFIVIKNVAIVRQEGGPYQTVRDGKTSDLVGNSTIAEEELAGILKEMGVNVSSVSDRLGSYDGFDTLILLGNPKYNNLTDKYFKKVKLSFSKWDDPNTPEHDFTHWNDFGREGYVLKVGRVGGKNIVILAGYDYDDAKKQFCGAGTFYALQSLRQLIVRDYGAVKIKTAEVADKPLVVFRGCMTGFEPSEGQQWRDVACIAAMKCNANIYWYGNGMAGYSVEAASKFRYPWRPEQLEFFGKVGKWCREHYITMVFCMNGDHYNVEWATAKTLDGKERDPAHYDPAYEVEVGFKEMWSKLGYDVHTDIDVLAAKFSQLNKAVKGGAMFQPMNEDDVFGLIHPADKKFFQTETGDARQDAINYGRARGQFLARLYKRVREMCPDSHDLMPFDPPGSLPYQTVLETNEYHSRDFLQSMSTTIKDMGVLEHTPVLTTGGGTLAEAIASKQIDDFKSWSDGAPILLHENNFAIAHVGAYETDPNGTRWPLQRSKNYPAGYRDKELYKRLWGIQWNGWGDASRILGWCQAQYMWNMLAADREKCNALAVRKVSSAKSYPLVKAFCEEFDRPIAYVPDDGPDQVVAISDDMAFRGKGWEYVIDYTDDMRVKAQRLRDKLAALIPKLEADWDNPIVKAASLRHPGYDAFNFCCVYLARGYIRGWKDAGIKSVDKLSGARLRDLYLEAEDIQQRYFAGPDEVAGKSIVDRDYFRGSLNHLYVARLKQPASAPAESPYYVDIWNEGLLGKFFEPVSSVALPDIADGDARLGEGWGKVEEVDKEKFRTVTGEALVKMDPAAKGRLLIRVRIGTAATALTESTRITLSTVDASHADAVCKPRWITWLLPKGKPASQLTIKAEKPVRVYAVELLTEKSP